MIKLKDLKDFDTWKKWKNGEVELEPLFSEKRVNELLCSQRGNSYVAILSKTKDEELASVASLAPEPWNWREKCKKTGKKTKKVEIDPDLVIKVEPRMIREDFRDVPPPPEDRIIKEGKISKPPKKK
jgi:hypothetical protein